jgi:hypothetical protein
VIRRRKAEWIDFEEGQKVTIDILIEVLEEARNRFGGATEIQAIGCYHSMGEILSVGVRDIERDNDYKGALIITDVCSG